MAADGYSGADDACALRRRCSMRKSALLAERQPYEGRWQTVGEYVDPFAGRYLPGNTVSRTTTNTTRGLPSWSKIINSTPTMALRGMDAGFMGGLSSKAQQWFRLGVFDPNLAMRSDVKRYCDDATNAMRDLLARSNFYSALPEFYHQRHLFGTAALSCEEDSRDVLRFYVRAAGTYAVGLDRRGRCNALWYSFTMTAGQLRDKFGRENLPRNVLDAVNNNRDDEKFTVESLTEENPNAIRGLLVPEDRRPIRQTYWIEGESSERHGVLLVTGHYEMPELVSRWSSTGSDIYGTSPVLDAAGDIRMLQYLEGKKLKIIDYIADPALTMPDSLREKIGTLAPGTRLFTTAAQTQQKVEAVYVPRADALTAVQTEIDRVTERINKALYVDLFRMLDFLDDRQRTAYEVSERKQEKIAQLGPSLESLTDEVFDPVIERGFAIADRAGALPPLPPSLHNVPLKIEYTSQIAQAAKALATSTIDRTLAMIASIAQAKGDPSVFDVLDDEETVRLVHDQQGAPEKMLRTPEEVDALRQQRQQQQRMAQMASMAPALKQGADALHTAGQTTPKDGSLLQTIGDAGASMMP